MSEENGNKNKPLVIQQGGDYVNLLDTNRFEHCYRVANLFAKSSLVPAHFAGKTEDCFVVMQMAFRLGMDPLMMLQNTYVVHGKPGILGQLAIALVNSSGLFTGSLKFRYEGKGETRSCTAYATEKKSGDVCEVTVSIDTAKQEGWLKNPKWKTMPDTMLAYRAGAWFARRYCPERLMGLQTVEEIEDVERNPEAAEQTKAAISEINAALDEPDECITLELEPDAKTIIEQQDLV